MAIKTLDAQASKVFSKDIIKDFKGLFEASSFYSRSEIDWYDKFNRFGCIDPFNGLSGCKEYIFFVRPDLHICEPGTMNLNPELANWPFFVELLQRYPDIVRSLQYSIATPGTRKSNVFIPVLGNSLKNTLDLPGISAETIDTSANIYGTSLHYRKNGLKSDEDFDFSLEFEDTKYLEIYHFFKAYEEYERLKSLGRVTPPNITGNTPGKTSGIAFTEYHKMRELHDQMAIYKIITEDDFETIVYIACITGVMPLSVPRDSFSDLKADGGLKYTIQFKGQFVDDMNPMIISSFNKIIFDNMVMPENDMPIFSDARAGIDGRWAGVPYIAKRKRTSYKQWLGPTTMAYDYKLKWRI